jgi:DNA-binding SARP family transcriptional activator/ABC-type transport system substrate-binding protein/streptogramin lyase
MEFGILGPVTAWSEGREVPLGGPKQRAVLALLLLGANDPVSRDRLIEGLWGERPPATAGHTLDNYISRLRRVLGRERLSTRAPGYVLHADEDELDLSRFERLFREGREALARGEATYAAAALREALDLWRGEALADVLYEPFAATESARLEQRRLMALEDRIDADLAEGLDAELVPELEALIRDQPFRERLIGQLMQALYRAGRQAEALAVLQGARLLFADELGLEPTAQLRDLERQILEQDPTLAAPRRESKPHVSRRRALGITAALAAVTTSVVIGIVLGSGSTIASRAVPGDADGLVVVDARSGRIDDAIQLAGAPGAMAIGEGSVWLADADHSSVLRIDPETRTVVDRIPVGNGPSDVAFGGGALWAGSTVAGAIARIDPATGTVTQNIELGVTESALAFGLGSLWVADPNDRALIRIDPDTGNKRMISLPEEPSDVAIGGAGVWVASHGGGTITQIDPRSNKPLQTVPVGPGPAALAVDRRVVWVANDLSGTVSKVDPVSASVVRTIPTGSGPSALVVANGSLWVANEFSGNVARIDPSRGEIRSSARVGGRPVSLASAGGRLLVGTRPSGASHRGGTLTLLGFRPGSIDPAFNKQWYPPPQFAGLAYDTLVTFDHTADPSGLQLVPDLALTLPPPSDGGRTYAFRLRQGIRYSDGTPLRASDFRRGIERLFVLGSPSAPSYANLVAAGQCVRSQAARCDLSRAIVTDDAARTIVFHLTGPDPEFLAKLAGGYAVPVPPGTPTYDVGPHPFPGTGPYLIAGSTPSSTRFVRNPRFREWSHAAQPSGYPDTIVWRYDLSSAGQTRAVQEGVADWMFEQIPPKLLAQIRIHRATQLRVNPVLGTEFLRIQTNRPPFESLKARRALNYAIDRDAIVRLYGGRSLAEPTCQLLPPGLSGYVRYCPYVQDLARARRLVAASHTAGMSVPIWIAADDHGFHARLMRYVSRVLRELGYRSRVRIASQQEIDGAAASGTIQLLPLTWFGGELGPSEFLQVWFSCEDRNDGDWFCDPRLERKMRRAVAMQAVDSKRAAADWAEIDRGVVDAAGSVPLLTPREVDFISRRMRNYQFHPLWGMLADQVWLH